MGVKVPDEESRCMVITLVLEEVAETVSFVWDIVVDRDDAEEQVISIFDLNHDGARCGQRVVSDILNKVSVRKGFV
jgi:hypothetical protein